MINIVTKQPTKDFIMNVDDYFNLFVLPSELDSADEKIMYEIDRARLLDKELGTIRTPFGITSIEHLSSGCKTVIGYRHRRAEDIGCVYNITMAGLNALEVLFRVVSEAKDSKTTFYLGYQGGLFRCKHTGFCINGKYSDRLSRGLALYGKC